MKKLLIFIWVVSALQAFAQSYPPYRQLPVYTKPEYDAYSTPGNNQQYMTGFAYSESDPSRIYMSQDVGGVWVSRDGGRIWNTLQNNGLHARFTMGLEVDPLDKNRVFVLAACEYYDSIHWGYQGIYRSDDGGITWNRKAVRDGIGTWRRTVHHLAYAPSTKNTTLGYTERWYVAVTEFVRTGTGINIEADEGFLYSDDGGETWTEIRKLDKATYTENIYGIRVDPVDKDVVYTYGAPGLAKFEDATNPTGTYTKISGTGGLPAGAINELPYISPDGNTLIVGVNNNGIYKSTDRGVNWTQIYSYNLLMKVFVNPGYPDVMYVTSPNTQPKLRVTKDGGATWNTNTNVTPVPGFSGNWNTGIYNAFAHVIPDPRNPDRAFVQGNAMFFQTDDGGNNWRPSNGYFNGNQIVSCSYEQMFDPVDPDRFSYFNVDIGIRTTTNRGKFFTADQGITTGAAPAMVTAKTCNGGAIHPTDRSIQLASVNSGASGKLLRTADGGTTWSIVSTSVAKRWYIFFDQQDPNYAYQWKERSDDAGATWTRLPVPGGGSEDWLVAGVSFQDGKVIYGYQIGAPSTRVYRSTDRGDTWTLAFTAPARIRSNGSEQFAFRVHPANHNIVFTSTPNTGGITKWDLSDPGNPVSTLLRIVPDPIETNFYIGRFAIDRRNPNVMYAANDRQGTGNKVFRTQDGGITWENITEGLPGQNSIGALEVSPVTGEVWLSTPNGVFILPPPYAVTEVEKSKMAYYTTAWSASHLSKPYDASAGGQTPYGGTARQLPGKLEAEHYNEGEKGVAYYDDYVKMGELSYRSNDLVDVLSDASASNGYSVGHTARGEWLNYTVNVEAGIYDISLVYSTESPVDGKVRLTLDGTEVGIFNLPGVPGTPGARVSSAYTTVTLEDVTLPAGTNSVLNVQVLEGANINLDALEFKDAFLPVRLSSFNVSKLRESGKNAASIQWTTAGEIESSHFEVEQSIDLKEWAKIDLVKSKGGETQHRYFSTHQNPASAINYYRLKMVDLDGTFNHSSILALDFSKDEPDLIVYPVPATGKLKVSTVPDSYRILDQTGKIISESRIVPKDGIDVGSLGSGIYFISVIQDGKTQTQKFIIQK